MKIAICDDEPIILTCLKRQITEIVQNRNWESEVMAFQSPIEMLEQASEWDILFLDMDMPDMDGIEAGRQMQRINPACKIVMATSHLERVKEAFTIAAHRFITKPFDRQEIEEAIQSCYAIYAGNREIILYKNRDAYPIKLTDVRLIKSMGSYCEFWVKDEWFRKNIALAELEAELPDNFARVHRAYMVNFDWILEYDGASIRIGEEKIPVSRRKRKAFEFAYRKYDLR